MHLRAAVLTVLLALCASLPTPAAADVRNISSGRYQLRDYACSDAKDLGRIFLRDTGGTLDYYGDCDCQQNPEGSGRAAGWWKCNLNLYYTPGARGDPPQQREPQDEPPEPPEE